LSAECGEGVASASPLPESRIVRNDVTIFGDVAVLRNIGPALGRNCLIRTSPASGNAIRIKAAFAFRDAYATSAGTEVSIRPMDWTTSAGAKLRVPAMVLKTGMGGIAEYGPMRVYALPFRNTQFALFVIVGRGQLSLGDARAYFKAINLRRRQDIAPRK
jgi:hypothetical protein